MSNLDKILTFWFFFHDGRQIYVLELPVVNSTVQNERFCNYTG
jgi:hypothetical protein